MKTIKVDLGSEVHNVNVYPIGDIHYGSNHFDKETLSKLFKEIDNDNNAVIILNGDLINNTVKTGVGDVYGEKLTPQQQLDGLVEMFEPYKNKIIGVVGGNHESRTLRMSGIDLTKEFCARLGILDKFDPIANVIFLSFGQSKGRLNSRVTFCIYHQHGTGGGRLVGAKANRVHNLSNIIQADIYIHSHTHVPLVFKENYIMTYNNSRGIKEVPRLFINTNAYEGFGGYGQEMGLSPSNRENIKVKLSYKNNADKVMLATI